jgi:hypothetical protein
MSSARIYVPAGTLTPEQRRVIVKGIHETINLSNSAQPTRRPIPMW